MSIFSRRRDHPPALPIGLVDFAILTVAVVYAIAFPIMFPLASVDYDTYLRTVNGNDSEWFYADYLLPLFQILNFFPRNVGLIILNIFNIIGIYLATRILGGNRLLCFLSYPFFFMIYYGQVDGLIVGGIGWMAYSLQHQKNGQAALAWLLILIKIQMGIILGPALLYVYATPTQRWQVIKITALLFGASQILWPAWAFHWFYHTLFTDNLNHIFSISLWPYTGALILLLWIPPLLSSPPRHMRWFAATFLLTTPYINPNGLLSLLVFPLGWVGWLVQIHFFTGPKGGILFQLVPFLIYLWHLPTWWQHNLLRQRWKKYRAKESVLQNALHANEGTTALNPIKISSITPTQKRYNRSHSNSQVEN